MFHNQKGKKIKLKSFLMNLILVLQSMNPIVIFADEPVTVQGKDVASCYAPDIAPMTTHLQPVNTNTNYMYNWVWEVSQAASITNGENNCTNPDGWVFGLPAIQPLSKSAFLGNLYSIGLNPTTLAPEGMDLDFFPSLKVSEALELKPILGYSEDSNLKERNVLRYGLPKNWHWNYGELVRILPHQEKQLLPELGLRLVWEEVDGELVEVAKTTREDLNSYATDPLNWNYGIINNAQQNPNCFIETTEAISNHRVPVPSVIKTYFMNAAGQHIEFYPDPDQLCDTNWELNDSDSARTWYSMSGNYRLSMEPDEKFHIETPNGLTFVLDAYKAELGKAMPGFDDDSFSIRYRVEEVRDEYGNYLDIKYDELNNQIKVFAMRGLNNYIFGSANKAPLVYEMDEHKRLRSMKLLKNAEEYMTYTFRYIDDLIQADSLEIPENYLEQFSIAQDLSISNDKLTSFVESAPVAEGLPCYFSVEADGLALYVNFDDLQWSNLYDQLQLQLDFKERDTQLAVEGCSAPIFKINNDYFQMKISNIADFQMYPHYTTAGEKYVNVMPVLGRNELDPRVDYPYDSELGNVALTYPDKIMLQPLGGAGSFTSSSSLVTVYPGIKNGDWAISENICIQIDPYDENYDPSQLDITSIDLKGANIPNSNSDIYLVREDNFYRIANIIFPKESNKGEELFILYDDSTTNHREIASVVRTFREIDSPSPGIDRLDILQRTDYQYQRISGLFTLNELVPDGGGGFGYSFLDQYISCSCHAANYVSSHIGLLFRRTEEIDTLRKKTVTVSGGLETDRTLKTYYGGVFNPTFVGQELENAPSLEQLKGLSSSAPVSDAGICSNVEWTLSARPFKMTWQINPDGSATVYDLSSKGLGFPSEEAAYLNGTRVFKTYYFETDFKDKLEQNRPSLLYFINDASQTNVLFDEQPKPFFRYLPTYPPASETTAFSDYTVVEENYEPLSMDYLFTESTCYKADIQLYEWIPRYKYSLLTDDWSTTGNHEHFIDETIKSVYGRAFYEKVLNTNNNNYNDDDNECPVNDVDNSKWISWEVSVSDILKEKQLDQSSLLASAKQFFSGDLVSDNIQLTMPTTGDLFENVNIKWSQGGRIFNRTPMKTLNRVMQREKICEMVPYFAYSLVDYEGLSFDPTQGVVDTSQILNQLDSGVRMSNGGYLGQYTTVNNVSVGSPNVLVAGWFDQPFVGTIKAGDFFSYSGRYYLVKEVTEYGDLVFYPSFEYSTQTINEQVPFDFYRFRYNNEIPFLVIASQYLGRDEFGNSSFHAELTSADFDDDQDTDIPTFGKFENAPLVPDFDNSVPSASKYTVNDSTQPFNNDTVNWRYFGRITRSFQWSHGPFWDYSAQSEPEVNDSSCQIGFLTVTNYDDALYPWLPVSQRSYFRPRILPALSLSCLEDVSSDPSEHDEDQLDVMFYYKPSGVGSTSPYFFEDSNQQNTGKLAQSVAIKSKGTTTLSLQYNYTNYSYDNLGRLEKTIELSRKSVYSGDTLSSDEWSPVSAMVSSYDYYHPLPTEEIQYVDYSSPTTAITWNNSNYPEPYGVKGIMNVANDLSSAIPVSKKLIGYDGNLRPVVEANLVEDASASGSLRWSVFGPITQTDYISPLQVENRSFKPKTLITALDPSNLPMGQLSQLSKSIQYFNGLNQPTFSFNQNGINSLVYGTQSQYDMNMRLEKDYFEVETQQTTFPTSGFGDFFAGKPYTKTVYNARGEDQGSVIYRYREQGYERESESWTHHKRENGQLNIYSLLLYNSGSDSIDEYVVKRQIFDPYGNLTKVNDFIIPKEDYQISLDVLSLSNLTTTNKKSNLRLYYDRFGNVIKTEVKAQPDVAGTAIQSRYFKYDQKSRLREEQHPELGALGKVTYQDFDLFNNAGKVIEYGGDGSSVRLTEHSFNAQGSLLQTKKANTLQTPISYLHKTDFVYQYQLGSSSLFKYPNSLAFVRVIDQSPKPEPDSGQEFYAVAYENKYDENTGLLLSREMRHSLGSHLPGYDDTIVNESNVTNLFSEHIDSYKTLKMEYAYETCSGKITLDRLTAFTYPTSLEKSKGLINRSNKLQFCYDNGTQQLTRIDDLNYGISVIHQIQFGPGGQVLSYKFANGQRISKDLDELNRLKLLKFELYPNRHFHHKYGYDLGGRVDSIQHTHSNSNSGDSFFTYDAIGQLTNAAISINLDINSPSGNKQANYAYAYDMMGNLNSVTVPDDSFFTIAVDSENNRLIHSGSSINNYTTFGEMEVIQALTTDQTAITNMGYNLAGRLTNESHEEDTENGSCNITSYYYYDPFGMRIYVEKEKTLTGAVTPETNGCLYVYDQNNLVINEIIDEDNQAKWDKTYIYFDGKSNVTYEDYNHTPLPVTTESPNLKTQGSVLEAKVEWDEVFNGYAYDIEVADADGHVLKSFFGNKADYQTLLRFQSGHYQYRVREQHGPWSGWQSFEIKDEETLSVIGHYKMEGNGQDSSFEQNHATVVGATIAPGVINQGYHLDGNDVLAVNNPNNFPAGEGVTLSLSAWLKPEPGVSHNQTIFYLSNDNNIKQTIIQLKQDGRFRIKKGKQTLNITNGPKIHWGQWNYVSVVIDHNKMDVFLNAEAIFQLINNKAFTLYSDIFQIGALSSGYSGDIDEVMIQNTALDLVRHQDRYYKSLPPECVLHYSFNNDDNKVVLDSSSYQNDGQKQGVSYTAGYDGTANTAYNFPGMDNVISGSVKGFPDGSDPFTVSAWVKPSGYNNVNFNSIVSLGSSACGPGVLLSLQNNGKFSGSYDCQEIFQVVGNGHLINQWQHVTIVYDGMGLYFYRDGQMIYDCSVNHELINMNRFLIGEGFNLQGSYFSGDIDEVRVFRGALAPDEIQNLIENE